MDLQEENLYEAPNFAVPNSNLHAAAGIELSQVVSNECYGVIESKQEVDECAVSCSAAEKVSDDEVKNSPKKRLICCIILPIIVMAVAVATALACLPVIFISISELNSKFPSLQQTEVDLFQQNNISSTNTTETTTQIISSIESLVNIMQEISQLSSNVAMLQQSILIINNTLTETLANQSLINILADISQLRSEIAALQENVSTNCEMTRQTLTTSFNRSLVAIWQVISQSRSGFSTLGQCSDVLENFGGVFIPAASCAAVLELVPSPPSGYYLISSSNDINTCVYCDMTRSCGGVTGGWMRVAELDMTNSSSQCPSGLRQRIDSNIRACGIASRGASCSSVTLPTGVTYSKVCGRVKGYQIGNPDGFGDSLRSYSQTINTNYVDGVSLTHGSPRQHIWTFATALHEYTSHPSSICPCTNTRLANSARSPPPFVGNDYFCDTGNQNRYSSIQSGIFYNNPLWDGAGCGRDSTCCSFNNPPRFFKQLSGPTTDNIEMRVCRDQVQSEEDVTIAAYDIYIQ